MINRILLYNSGGGIGDALQILPLINALKNEFIKVFEQHGGPARLAELMAKSPEKYFEFLVRLQPKEIVADVTTSHQPTIAAPPAAPESLTEWMARKDDIVEALPQDGAADALLKAEVASNGHGSY